MSKHAIHYFESQFQRQVAGGEFVLNPFERMALPYLRGDVLDLGCGLGNLAMEAARCGCKVTALDGSATGIAHLRETALCAGLDLEAHEADLAHYVFERDYDAIAAIGLLMFFPQVQAEGLLAEIVKHVRPEGVAVLNVLTEDTTFLGMFEPGHYHLFPRGALVEAMAGWEVLLSSHDCFPAPNDQVKAFDTVIARRPGV